MKAEKVFKNVDYIKFMNEMVMDIGNEYAEEMWLMVYPDGADFADQIEMAKDPQMMGWLVDCFRDVMKAYGGWK